MTGQEIQERLDMIVTDLQTTQKGKAVDVGVRGVEGGLKIHTISSDGRGSVDQAQLAEVQTIVDSLKPVADAYETERAPVTAAGEVFRDARAVHQPLIDAYAAARDAMNDAFEADANYQAALTAYNDARNDPEYIAARNNYRDYSVSENYGNLGEARQNYR